jgi:hypothetical protein
MAYSPIASALTPATAGEDSPRTLAERQTESFLNRYDITKDKADAMVSMMNVNPAKNPIPYTLNS